jgi:Xaa-Pro aminopeptidase
MTGCAARRERLRERMARADVPALLVTHLPDVRYLCGFSGSNGALLVMPDLVALATDGRYRTQAAQQAPDVQLLVTRSLATELLGLAATRNVGRVGFDPHTVTVATHQAASRDAAVAFEPVNVDVSGLRQVKDEDELASLTEACRATVEALQAMLAQIRVGMTEVEIARRLEVEMGLAGADDRAFETIVAAGPNSAIPHNNPTARPIRAGDLLKIDFGAMVDGYHADCTRTFVVAAEPEAWQLEIHDVVRRAQRAGMESLRPGVHARDVDAAARAVIDDAGYGRHYPHGLGHGVGLEIHEAPFLGAQATHTVECGVPLTVEPGVYLPGRGGVRIEDTVVVGDDDVTVLTDYPRELARVG